jgi:hypothetical protein
MDIDPATPLRLAASREEEQMITTTRANDRGDVVDCQPPPFNYPQDRSYTTQLLLNAVVVVALAAVTVMAGLPLAGINT